MREWKKMVDGELFDPGDEELKALRDFARSECFRFNNDPTERRIDILRKLFGKTGEAFKVHPTFQCDYGVNIEVGDHFLADYDCIILDAGRVSFGDNCFLAPRVTIFTNQQSENTFERNTGKAYAKPVTVGSNVWIGAAAVIAPGVVIGDDAVVSAGSVVMSDVPAHTMVAGNPAKIIKNIE